MSNEMEGIKMYCKKCGHELIDEAVVCTNCGCATNEAAFKEATGEDKAKAGLIVLSILLPIVGVILWPVKHKETPKAAQTYGIAGIVSWIVWAVVFSL